MFCALSWLITKIIKINLGNVQTMAIERAQEQPFRRCYSPLKCQCRAHNIRRVLFWGRQFHGEHQPVYKIYAAL